jgi:hypothetical protein
MAARGKTGGKAKQEWVTFDDVELAAKIEAGDVQFHIDWNDEALVKGHIKPGETAATVHYGNISLIDAKSENPTPVRFKVQVVRGQALRIDATSQYYKPYAPSFVVVAGKGRAFVPAGGDSQIYDQVIRDAINEFLQAEMARLTKEKNVLARKAKGLVTTGWCKYERENKKTNTIDAIEDGPFLEMTVKSFTKFFNACKEVVDPESGVAQVESLMFRGKPAVHSNFHNFMDNNGTVVTVTYSPTFSV